MSYYFVANITINDKKEYQKYVDKVDEVFSKFNGKYLAIDDNPILLEGKWNYKRAVLIEFKSKSDFDDWLNAADCDTILIKGNN